MTSVTKKRAFGLLLLVAAMIITVSFITFERSTLSYRSERSGYLFERVKQAFQLLRFQGETSEQGRWISLRFGNFQERYLIGTIHI